jgi:enoyl-[acyl-carrier-protein] reductase (NADH)
MQIIGMNADLLALVQGYLAAVSASSFSFVSLVQQFAPIMNEGGSALCLTYLASTSIIPGYGGGMSSAKAVCFNCPCYTFTCAVYPNTQMSSGNN